MNQYPSCILPFTRSSPKTSSCRWELLCEVPPTCNPQTPTMKQTLHRNQTLIMPYHVHVIHDSFAMKQSCHPKPSSHASRPSHQQPTPPHHPLYVVDHTYISSPTV